MTKTPRKVINKFRKVLNDENWGIARMLKAGNAIADVAEELLELNTCLNSDLDVEIEENGELKAERDTLAAENKRLAERVKELEELIADTLETQTVHGVSETYTILDKGLQARLRAILQPQDGTPHEGGD